jgi:hypothetical protein
VGKSRTYKNYNTSIIKDTLVAFFFFVANIVLPNVSTAYINVTDRL